MLVMSLLFYGCETVPPETKITINNTLNISNKADIDKSKQVFKVIKVGLFLPLSGSNAKIGKSILNATQLSLSKTQNGNIEVFVRDTEDINKNIISSYYELINKDVDIILGPLFSKNIKKIKPVSEDENVIMITFSNNMSLKSENTFISGLTPENEVTEILEYALSKGKKKFGVILPDNDYGLRTKNLIESLLLSKQGQLSKLVLYNSESPDFYQAAKLIADYDNRKLKLEKKLQKLKNLNTVTAKKKYKVLKNKDTLGDLEFDSLYIGSESVKHLSMLASILPYYDVDPKEVLYIGNSLWSHNIALKEPALEKGIFPDFSRVNYKKYDKEYFEAFDQKPHKISSIAFDLIGLLSSMQTNNKDITIANIANNNGFLGTNGLFRFKKDGNIERSLSIYQIKDQQIKEIKKANLNFN
jgi:hypothetical protein